MIEQYWVFNLFFLFLYDKKSNKSIQLLVLVSMLNSSTVDGESSRGTRHSFRSLPHIVPRFLVRVNRIPYSIYRTVYTVYRTVYTVYRTEGRARGGGGGGRGAGARLPLKGLHFADRPPRQHPLTPPRPTRKLPHPAPRSKTRQVSTLVAMEPIQQRDKIYIPYEL